MIHSPPSLPGRVSAGVGALQPAMLGEHRYCVAPVAAGVTFAPRADAICRDGRNWGKALGDCCLVETRTQTNSKDAVHRDADDIETTSWRPRSKFGALSIAVS